MTATTASQQSPALVPEPHAGEGEGIVATLGGLAILGGTAAFSWLRPRGLVTPFVREVDGLFRIGLPLVGLVHIGFGSFLAMQSYFGATFSEAVGAVVGVGLLRNVAPLLTGLTMAGLVAGTMTPELRRRRLRGGDDDPAWVPDREGARGEDSLATATWEPARLAAVRIAAAAVAGPCLTLWGALVGSVIGFLVAHSVLGISSSVFLAAFSDLVRPLDFAGVACKGAAFSGFSALIACHFGLQSPRDGESVYSPSFRAVCGSILAILFLNFTWFQVMYLSGTPFGPELSSLSATP